jgi:hypothetical protein
LRRKNQAALHYRLLTLWGTMIQRKRAIGQARAQRVEWLHIITNYRGKYAKKFVIGRIRTAQGQP